MNTDNHTLLALIKGAKEGFLPAQEMLYRQYAKAMYNICIRMCGNEDDAHDLLQEGFITAFGKINQLKEAATFGGWLKRIIVNQCIAFSRKKMLFVQLPPAELEIVKGSDETWWNNISIVQIHEAIKLLPEGCRQVFVLFAIENYTHKQIANELQLSEGTSKSQYSRAKQLLQQMILKKMVANG